LFQGEYRFPHTDVAREVRLDVETGQQVHRREVTRGDMSPQDILELAVLIGMSRFGRKCHHPPAPDDLVARDLGLDQVLVNRRESSPTRQVQRAARGTQLNMIAGTGLWI
jgi:hypothetical protein